VRDLARGVRVLVSLLPVKIQSMAQVEEEEGQIEAERGEGLARVGGLTQCL
jgi:hypothetical protein